MNGVCEKGRAVPTASEGPECELRHHVSQWTPFILTLWSWRGPCDYCHTHRPCCDNNIWLMHLFARLMCLARILCTNKATHVS